MSDALVGAMQWRVPRRSVVHALLATCLTLAVAGAWFAFGDHSAPAPARTAVHARGLASLPTSLQPMASSAVGASRANFAVRGLRATTGHLTTAFARSGPIVSAGGATLRLHVAGIGRGDSISALPTASPAASKNQVLYQRGRVTEWYRNGPLGLEQGFTVAHRPTAGAGQLTISEQLTGALRARLSGSGIQLSRAGHSLLRLDQLSATDATGRALRSHFELSGSSVLLRIDDAGATYPVKVDPMISQAQLGPGDTQWHEFGYSVALSSDGNTALIGGPGLAIAGEAWVFTRSGSTWTQQTTLTPSDSTGNGSFGWTVALSSNGNTALIGGPGDNSNKGAAWVFTRSGSTWTQQGSKITPSDETGNGQFGSSAALSSDGNTALIGGYGDNSTNGAAWVFTRSGSTWTQQGSKITPSDESGSGAFGTSAALSSDGTTALIGGPLDSSSSGAAWVFTNSGSGWSEVSKLTVAGGGQFGTSVALSSDGETALIGAPRDGSSNNPPGVGAAYAFVNSGSSWSQQGPKLVPNDIQPAAEPIMFGQSVSLSGDGNTALIGAPNYNNPDESGLTLGQGAAELFTRSGSTWTQAQPKTPGPFAAASGFGWSAALSSDNTTALVGAPQDPSQDFVNNNKYGAAAVYTVDVTPPAPFTSIAPPDNSYVTGSSFSFSWNQTTDTGSGVDHYVVVINGVTSWTVPTSACSGGVCTSANRAPLNSGTTYSWYVTAVDGQGNATSTPSRSLTVDGTPPATFNLLSPAAGSVLNSVSLKWQQTTDSISGMDHYDVWIDGAKYQTVAASTCSAGSCSATVSGLADGHHTWSVKAFDVAGNNRSSNQTWDFTLDATPPAAFQLLTPGSGAVNQAPRTAFSWQQTTDAGSGIDHYELWIDGSKDQNVANSACSGGTCSATASSALANGSHSWLIKAVDGAGNVRTSGPRSFSVTAPPTNTARPTISGTAQQGQMLTESHGSWTGSPSSFRYQWADCDGSVSNCVPISGATGQTYTLTSADVGHRVVALETAVNGGGASAPAQSNATNTVIPLPPANVSPPTITGTPAIGHTLTESHGSWTNNPTSFTYQWQACNSTGGNCASISGATSQTYTVQGGDAQKTFRVLETAYNQGGHSSPATSAATAPVPPSGPVGVLINSGDYATSNPHVTINLIWPAGTRQVVISNDGGFGTTGNAHSFQIATQIPWTLKQTGSDRLTKIVYLRFQGAGMDLVNFTDDIILDETAPAVQTAQLLTASKPKAGAARAVQEPHLRDSPQGQ